MDKDPGSLDRLNDIVLPEPVSWWPLAPGWYVVITLVVGALGYLGVKKFRAWRADAYRREALKELEQAGSLVECAEILRRSALAMITREEVATLQGDRWISWLEARLDGEIPDEVRPVLSGGVYRPGREKNDEGQFREFVRSWILTHHRPC